jgi:polysaccharide pyruvyl transferase WcaK-like protein
MTLVAPFGFYGWGNIGDESTLQGFGRLIGSRRPAPSVWVGSRNPAHTRRVEPSFRYFDATRRSLRERWAKYQATATVFPGGTPIMDGLGDWPLSDVAPLVSEAHDRGRPIVFVGAGTERLQRAASRGIVRDVLATRVTHWTVRSERDRERLTEAGVPGDRVTVAADLAWLLAPVSTDFGRRALDELRLPTLHPVIGINVNNEPGILERDPAFFEKLAAFADRLIERQDARVLFFCSEVREGSSFDKAAGGKVLATMRNPESATMLPNRYWTPQELLSVIACCRIVVSTRYHVCLFSAVQQVPFVALQRSDKVSDLCGDIEWRYGVSLDRLDVAALLDMVDDIERRRAPLVDALRHASDRQARRSLVNRVALEALGHTGPRSRH